MAQYSKKEKEGIGGRVEALRQERGWSAEKLAELLDTTRSSINMKERGERPFSLDEACNICGLFDLTLDELVSGVKTENVKIQKKLGLNDKAIEMLSTFWMLYGDEGISVVNKVLASIETLAALSDYLNYHPTKEGYLLTTGQENEAGVVTCSMSQEVYEVILEQNLLRTLRTVKDKKGASKYYFMPEDYEKANKKKDT